MKYKRRIADDLLSLKLEFFGASLITGPKGCGKTTTAKQQARSVIELQDEDNRDQYLAVAKDQVSLLLVGDILLDGGNSHFKDTVRRYEDLKTENLRFLGVGVSGGEQGALLGPCIMPSGDKDTYHEVQAILEDISAKAEDGKPCCDYVGESGSGHYVKMVHNGIEYADIQIICEAYSLMRDGLNLSIDEIQKVFERWNEGKLQSYLIAITSEILK